MRVRLIKHWQGWKPGKVFESMSDGPANILIRRGVAEPVHPAGVAPAAASKRRAEKPRSR